MICHSLSSSTTSSSLCGKVNPWLYLSIYNGIGGSFFNFHAFHSFPRLYLEFNCTVFDSVITIQYTVTVINIHKLLSVTVFYFFLSNDQQTDLPTKEDRYENV